MFVPPFGHHGHPGHHPMKPHFFGPPMHGPPIVHGPPMAHGPPPHMMHGHPPMIGPPMHPPIHLPKPHMSLPGHVMKPHFIHDSPMHGMKKGANFHPLPQKYPKKTMARSFKPRTLHKKPRRILLIRQRSGMNMPNTYEYQRQISRVAQSMYERGVNYNNNYDRRQYDNRNNNDNYNINNNNINYNNNNNNNDGLGFRNHERNNANLPEFDARNWDIITNGDIMNNNDNNFGRNGDLHPPHLREVVDSGNRVEIRKNSVKSRRVGGSVKRQSIRRSKERNNSNSLSGNTIDLTGSTVIASNNDIGSDILSSNFLDKSNSGFHSEKVNIRRDRIKSSTKRTDTSSTVTRLNSNSRNNDNRNSINRRNNNNSNRNSNRNSSSRENSNTMNNNNNNSNNNNNNNNNDRNRNSMNSLNRNNNGNTKNSRNSRNNEQQRNSNNNRNNNNNSISKNNGNSNNNNNNSNKISRNNNSNNKNRDNSGNLAGLAGSLIDLSSMGMDASANNQNTDNSALSPLSATSSLSGPSSISASASLANSNNANNAAVSAVADLNGNSINSAENLLGASDLLLIDSNGLSPAEVAATALPIAGDALSGVVDLSATGGNTNGIGSTNFDVLTLDKGAFAQLEHALQSGKTVNANLLDSIISSGGATNNGGSFTAGLAASPLTTAGITDPGSAAPQIIILDQAQAQHLTESAGGPQIVDLHSSSSSSKSAHSSKQTSSTSSSSSHSTVDIPHAGKVLPAGPGHHMSGGHAGNIMGGHTHGHGIVGILGEPIKAITMGSNADLMGLFSAPDASNLSNIPASVVSIPESIGRRMPSGHQHSGHTGMAHSRGHVMPAGHGSHASHSSHGAHCKYCCCSLH